MRVVQRRLWEFYVGTLKRRNSDELGLIVYTAAEQTGAASDNYVRLYELAEDTIGDFHKDTIRPLIGPPGNRSRRG